MKKIKRVVFCCSLSICGCAIFTTDVYAVMTTRTFTSASGIKVTEISSGNVSVMTYDRSPANVEIDNSNPNETQIRIRPSKKARSTKKLRSVYELSLASGMSPEEACNFSKDMDPFGCLSYKAYKKKIATAKPTSKPIYDSDCFDHVTHKGDGSKHAHACYVRYSDYRGSKFRYIGAKMKTTAWSVDPGLFHDRINGVGIQLKYQASDSFAVDWDPSDSQSVGECRDVTTSATSPKSGVSYQSTTTVCPNTLSPWHSEKFQYFGAKWTGEAAPEDERRGAVASSVQKIPIRQTTGVVIESWLHWGN